jgi:uncharacterized membrane protein (GlpM family)
MTINVCRQRAECPVNILFVASVSAIVRDVSAARGFYTDGLVPHQATFAFLMVAARVTI